MSPEAVFEHVSDMLAWYIDDAEITLDRETAGRILIDFGDPRSRHWELMRRGTAPPESMLSARMQALTLGVLGQLGCTANWHRIAREWLFGDPPSTPAGRGRDRVLRPRPAHGRLTRAVPRPSAGNRTQPVEASPEAIALLREDPVMASMLDRFGPLDEVLRRSGRRPTEAYGALLRAIVGQQLSTKAAKSIYGRLEEMFGGRAPTPAELLAADPEEVRSVGLSRPKVAYLRDLAEHVEDGRLELDRLADLPDDEVIAQLTAVKGLGEWTAHMFLIFHLGRPDVLPVGDLGIRNAAALAYELERPPKPAELTELAEALAAPPLTGVAVPLAVVGQHAGLDRSSAPEPPEPAVQGRRERSVLCRRADRGRRMRRLRRYAA